MSAAQLQDLAYFQDAGFVAAQVATFPARWQKRLIAAHHALHGRNRYQANSNLRKLLAVLNTVKLPLDATDRDICDKAAEFVGEGFKLAELFPSLHEFRLALERLCLRVGLRPAGVVEKEVKSLGGVYLLWDKKMGTRAAVRRMTCLHWWRRGLRKMHAKYVEATAIQLGYVSRARELYASHETVARRAAQNRRNARMMEDTYMRNELEQEFSLADLAAKGTGNKTIRRGELMTRLVGFEKIALDCAHEGIFLTLTAPSRMHRFSTVPNSEKVFANPKYDETTNPKKTQDFLCKAWSRIRAELARLGVKYYGFRVVEPHHDACPHWHMLFFVEPQLSGGRSAVPRMLAVIRHYLLEREYTAMSEFNEQAAALLMLTSKGRRSYAKQLQSAEKIALMRAEKKDAARRKQALNHKRIDASKGSAVGYMAKYISKNIDGFAVGDDLFGNPAIETCQRVEAWATTWGIRQFQQIGGAPVGVWRELRRVKQLPDDAPQHLKDAWVATNKVAASDESEAQQADFAAYVTAQGGAFVGRDAAIKLNKEQTGEIGKYGEMMDAKPVGVETLGVKFIQDGIASFPKLVEWVVKSVRHVWEVVKSAARGVKKAADFSPPWTCVNNCTDLNFSLT